MEILVDKQVQWNRVVSQADILTNISRSTGQQYTSRVECIATAPTSGRGAGRDNTKSQADWQTLGVGILVDKQAQLNRVVSQADILTDIGRSTEQTNK